MSGGYERMHTQNRTAPQFAWFLSKYVCRADCAVLKSGGERESTVQKNALLAQADATAFLMPL
jgi:hypothetical protein